MQRRQFNRLCVNFLLLSILSHRTTPVHAVRKTRLTWVNGIAHTIEHMENAKVTISNLFGGKPVIYCHNPTAMSHEEDYVGYIGDLTQATTQKFGRITTEVNNLVRHLKEAVAAVGTKGRVVHIAHSQGALLTSLAARQLTPLEMSKIEVVAFGGAAALRKTPQTPFVRCVNYYSINDPLLWVVPQAAHALKSGFVGDEEFCFLTPRVGDPIRDHNLLGPTYKTALAWEGQRFQREYLPLIYRILRPTMLAIVALQVVASEQLTVLLRPILDVAIMLWQWFQAKIVQPVAVVLAAIVLVLGEVIRTWKGEEKYVPIQSLEIDWNESNNKK